MEIILDVNFFYVRYRDVFPITSKLRYLYVHCKYVFMMKLELRYILVRYEYYALKTFSYVCS